MLICGINQKKSMIKRILWFKKRNANKNIDQVLDLIVRYSFILFPAGMIFDTITYLVGKEYVLLWANILALVWFAVTFVRYATKHLRADSAILLNMIIISLNLALSIVYEGVKGGPEAPPAVILNMCIFIIPVLLSVFSNRRAAPLLFTTLALIAYTISAFILKDIRMIQAMPTLILIYLGSPIVLKSIIRVSRKIERDNLMVLQEKQDLFRMLNLEEKQYSLLQARNVDKKRSSELFDTLDARVKDILVSRAKEAISDEQHIIVSLKDHYPFLTSAEVEICAMIVDNKTVSEICEIRHVSPSTVTSVRSRLRKKIGLEEGTSLKTHLQSVVYGSLSGQ